MMDAPDRKGCKKINILPVSKITFHAVSMPQWPDRKDDILVSPGHCRQLGAVLDQLCES
jgi:hypothetical protein